MPDCLVLPDGSDLDVEFVMGLLAVEEVWDLLRESERPPL